MTDRAALAAWYFRQFVPDPAAGYAVMKPPTRDGAKYYASSKELTLQQVIDALEGKERRATADGHRVSVPFSYAVVQRKGGERGHAWAAVLDIDTGGVEAIAHGLTSCSELGLWAFGQLSEGDKHTGGHVWIPFDRPHPASLLYDLSLRLKAATGLDAEPYPTGAKLRPPLMPHLWTPGGARRFPILLQSGELIEPEAAAWDALERLQEVWQPNPPAALIAALGALPELQDNPASPRHKSKVNPYNGESVIDWYNENHSLEDLLHDAGANTAAINEKGFSSIRCPYHDDKTPSLSVWPLSEANYLVCHCYSTNCKAHNDPGHYHDPFSLYCLANNLSASDAVKEIAERYQLGERRTFKSEATQPEKAPLTEDTLTEHRRRVEEARECLASLLSEATQARGRVTVFDAIMGIGKTHAGAELARERHAAGDTVAIVAPTRAHALEEWAARLGPDAFVWRPKAELCTCWAPGLVATLGRLGYVVPECAPGCPYAAQHDTRAGRIVVYQHNHLHLNNGELLAGADCVIIDESPYSALMEEHHAHSEDIRNLYNRLANYRGADLKPDPALPLVKALFELGLQHKPALASLRGRPLVEALEALLGSSLIGAIEAARQSSSASPQPAPDRVLKTGALGELPPVFFGSLLDALEQSARNPEHGGGLAWGMIDGGGAWLWFERHRLALNCWERLERPAVLVLDGSANEDINARLLAPWDVVTHTLDIPLSPLVEVVQVACTAHTRRVVQEARTLDYLARYVGVTAHKLGLVVDGGITFMAARDHLAGALGGDWLHYGGQRGRNDLQHKNTLALVGSPTIPPDALERAALALWEDGAPLATSATGDLWERRGSGDYVAIDSRLAAVDRLHGPEELRQAAHRARLILAETPKTVLVFSPWPLDELGLYPDQVITQLPSGNSSEAREAWATYQTVRPLPAPGKAYVSVGESPANGQLGSFSIVGDETPSIPLSQLKNGKVNHDQPRRQESKPLPEDVAGALPPLEEGQNYLKAGDFEAARACFVRVTDAHKRGQWIREANNLEREAARRGMVAAD